MKKISELLSGVGCSWNGVGDLSDPIRAIQVDSRKVEKGDLFVAVPGSKLDGNQFIQDAVKRGAWGIVSEQTGSEPGLKNIPQFNVRNARKAFSRLVVNYYGQPSSRLSLIGVTGTNGKTTISLLLHYLLNRFSSCGLFGTVFYDDGKSKREATHTTPSADVLSEMFLSMVENGLLYCAMEVSSHALDQDRTEGLSFRGAVFTNLTQDHFDYHKGFEEYYQAKKKLFVNDDPPKFSVINVDDPYGERLANEITESKIVTYGFGQNCSYRAEPVSIGARGVEFNLFRENVCFKVAVPLPFRYNILNVLAVLASVEQLGFSVEQAISFLKDFPGVPGRMELVDVGQDSHVFVDYAHTPDAFKNVLSAARLSAPKRMITVFGCGGDRDRAKRPQMGKMASEYSDVVVVTSDNPRTENPQTIIEEIKKGIEIKDGKPELFVISEREKAIEQALNLARADDYVLILGKGHEDYQIIGTQKIPFRDQDVVRRYFNGKVASGAKI